MKSPQTKPGQEESSPSLLKPQDKTGRQRELGLSLESCQDYEAKRTAQEMVERDSLGDSGVNSSPEILQARKLVLMCGL